METHQPASQPAGGSLIARQNRFRGETELHANFFASIFHVQVKFNRFPLLIENDMLKFPLFSRLIIHPSPLYKYIREYLHTSNHLFNESIGK
jgi:hypothetical protein